MSQSQIEQAESGVQGLPGSYTWSMHRELFPGQEPSSFDTFDEGFDALYAHRIGRLTVAYANNAVNFIPIPYSRLTSHRAAEELFIDTEGVWAVEHCLLVQPGLKFKDITEVHSQLPALDQCSGFLEHMPRKIKVIAQDDTAKSAEYVAKNPDKPIAAIASIQAAELYGLHALKIGIQNDPQNLTRFVSVTRREDARVNPNANVTNAIMTIQQHVGALADTLTVYKDMGIDLRFVNTRLIPNKPFAADVVLEFKMGLGDARMPKLVAKLAVHHATLDVLGSFVSASNGFHKSDTVRLVNVAEEQDKYRALLDHLQRPA